MKIRKELWFGFILMGLILAAAAFVFGTADNLTRGHLGLLMLSLVVVAIMLGFPTAFTLMGMGIIFTWLAYDRDLGRTLDLMVQSTFKVMSNDVLISIPLFVFMGYLVERANLIEKLFKSLHLAMARVPGSLAVATLVTCAVFATATGIVGAVVTLMGLLAFPAMLKAGYNTKLGAGAITAGGCLGILIPPSVMLIVYGATAGVSVVQLYAGAFFPGIMLAGLYVLYVIIIAKIKPEWAPPLALADRVVKLPAPMEALSRKTERALPGLLAGFKGRHNDTVPLRTLWNHLLIALAPGAVALLLLNSVYGSATAPLAPEAGMQAGDQVAEPLGAEAVTAEADASGLAEPKADGAAEPATGLGEPPSAAAAVAEPPAAAGVSEPPAAAASLAEPPAAAASGVAEPPGAAAPPAGASADAVREPPGAPAVAGSVAEPPAAGAAGPAAAPRPAPTWFWIFAAIVVAATLAFYATFTFKRLEIFKMLLASFFPLVVLILAVLGSIVFGLATPTEAAAVGAFGGYVLAAIYILINRHPERLRRVLKIWLPFWILFGFVVLWIIARNAGAPVPAIPVWLGETAIILVGIWAFIAIRQIALLAPVRESVLLTGKTSAMVCWLFVGSAIFSAAFALLGGQELVENWVVGLNLTKTEFLILSQVIIFVLGWPLEWTEIIVIFMPIFIPLLDNFGVDPLFFGLLVALNLQTAFLSPPVAMAAFYLKGVSPPHVTLNQIFGGMLPFMGIQVIAIVLLYNFPEIGLWLPQQVYGR